MTVEGRGGVALHVRTVGPPGGHPVVLLHGQRSNGRVWDEVLRTSLTDRYRLIVPDLRGHGRSAGPRFGYRDSETWGFDLAAVIGQVATAPPTLVGWSYGSAVACDYLRLGRPAASLVIVGGGPEAGVLDRRVRATIGPDVRNLALRRMLRRVSSQQATTEFVDLFTDHPLATRQRQELIADAQSVRTPAARGVLSRRYWNDDVLQAFDGPILQLHGLHDRIRLVSAAQRRAEAVPSLKSVIWHDAGHAPFLEHPERFAELTATFIDQAHIGGRTQTTHYRSGL